MDMDSALVVGNWKMHGTLPDGLRRAEDVARFLAGGDFSAVETVLCPPATLLHTLRDRLGGARIGLGGQDCHFRSEGAHTGDLSAAMLKDAGCAYVIVGHSERRADHGEDGALVRKKAEAALRAGLTPIICVGESGEQRDRGQAKAAVEAQLAASLPQAGRERVAVAYEPVWSIGTGIVPRAEDISGMHGHIISLIPEKVRVLYGGSVKPDNARGILGLAGVHGVLVGGASLDAPAFCEIIRAAAEAS